MADILGKTVKVAVIQKLEVVLELRHVELVDVNLMEILNQRSILTRCLIKYHWMVGLTFMFPIVLKVFSHFGIGHRLFGAS